jgi:hypothetical protein
MNRTQLEHIIRATSRISADSEIVVIGLLPSERLESPLLRRSEVPLDGGSGGSR